MKAFLLAFGLLAVLASLASAVPVGDQVQVDEIARQSFDNKNVIDVPVVCKPGEAADANGRCRPIHRSAQELLRQQTILYLACLIERKTSPALDCSKKSGFRPQNVIDVPPTCPPGQLPDQNGRCRPIHRGDIQFRGI